MIRHLYAVLGLLRSRIRRLALATLALSIAWMATVSADNLDPAVATANPPQPASRAIWHS
jgi:hypothetical protein